MLDEDGGFFGSDENGVPYDQDTYIDYSVGVTYSWASVDFSVAWVGTDLDEDDVGKGFEEAGDDTAVFTISKSF